MKPTGPRRSPACPGLPSPQGPPEVFLACRRDHTTPGSKLRGGPGSWGHPAPWQGSGRPPAFTFRPAPSRCVHVRRAFHTFVSRLFSPPPSLSFPASSFLNSAPLPKQLGRHLPEWALPRRSAPTAVVLALRRKGLLTRLLSQERTPSPRAGAQSCLPPVPGGSGQWEQLVGRPRVSSATPTACGARLDASWAVWRCGKAEKAGVLTPGRPGFEYLFHHSLAK